MELRFFKYEEFDCPMKPNSGYSHMDRQFLVALDEARRLSQLKFKIIEGFKSTDRQRKEGGYRNNPHLIGRAAKIKCSHGNKRYKIVASLLEAGFTRIGLNPKYIYVDNDDLRPDSIWLEN